MTAVVSNFDSVDIPSDADVYYYQHEDTPGLCVENSDGDLSSSPVKLSHCGIISQDSPGCTETIDVSDIDVIECHSRGGVPGFEVTTPDDCVWFPCRTRSRIKSLFSVIFFTVMALDLRFRVHACTYTSLRLLRRVYQYSNNNNKERAWFARSPLAPVSKHISYFT